MTLYQHPATTPANLRRLIDHSSLEAVTTALRAANLNTVRAWSEGVVTPSMQSQKKIARLWCATFPAELPALRERLRDDLNRAERTLDNALHERTYAEDTSHKPARRNMLLVQIHLNELEQMIRAGTQHG